MRSFTLGNLLIFLLAASASAQSVWTQQPSGTRGDLVAVYFTSSDTGWIAGDKGFLASTTDGGRTWERYPLNTTEDINEIYFRNDKNGYLVAGRKMYITHDAGRSWEETRIYRNGEFGAGTPDFLSIRFSDKKHGYVIGSILRRVGGEDVVTDSLLMRTEDEGDTWQRIPVPSKGELFHLTFRGNSRGWIVGDKGVILASTDEGMTWHLQRSGVERALFNVDFRDNDNGYAVGGGGTILRTENGGSTWDRVSIPWNNTLMRVDFADDKNGWIVGWGGDILRSGDRGKTWIRQESSTTKRLYGLYMEKKYGWAVGEDGVVLKYKK